MIGYQLASHPKVDFSHVVMAGVIGTHGCKYLTDGAELLLDQSLLVGITLCRKKSGTDVVGKKMEERNRVFGAFKVRGNL